MSSKNKNSCLLFQRLIFFTLTWFCFRNVSISTNNSSVALVMNSDFWSHLSIFMFISFPGDKKLISDKFNRKLFFSIANARRDLRFWLLSELLQVLTVICNYSISHWYQNLNRILVFQHAYRKCADVPIFL